MRDIEFRGLRKFCRLPTWDYGCYLHTWTKELISNLNGDYEVKPETITQYTGLKDKKRTEEFPNGQEIYEGDIVKCIISGTEFSFKVCFGEYSITTLNDDDKQYGWYLDSLDKDNLLRKDILFWLRRYGLEVVGNIYKKGDTENG